MIILFRFIFLGILNYLVFLTSPFIATFQLVKDIRILFNIETSQIYITYLIVSILVAALTLLLIRIFKPFIEIYLLHYSRYFFNVLVCLLSLSSVYIVLRVYGYSRLSLIVYLFISSLFLTYSGKFLNFGKN